MEFSITQLLDSFSDDKLVAPKVIEKRLGITDQPPEVRRMQVALDALERLGILTKDLGRYRRVAEDGVVEGRLRCSSKGFCFAIQEGEGVEDIYVPSSRLSTAWNGDLVLVKVLKDGGRRRSPEGEVRLILERTNTTLLSRVEVKEEGYRAIPLDDRLLFELELLPNEVVPDLSQAAGKLVHLRVSRYPLGSALPTAEILQVLGDSPETTNDLDLVCCKYNLPRQFGAKELAAAASLPTKVRKADLKSRLDLKKECAVRIGQGAAISLEPTESGWSLGVHIPDVATYVVPDSPLDGEARRRLRSFFLGDAVLPMLPELNGFNHPEFLTVSVLMQLDPTGQLMGYELQPSVIQLRSHLEPRRAQEIFEESQNIPDRDEVQQLLHRLHDLGVLLRQRRPMPSIDLSQVLPFEGDEGVWGMSVYGATVPICGAVADVMILANSAIAQHWQQLGLPGLYVSQPSPEQTKQDDWLRLLESLGMPLDLAEGDVCQPHHWQQLLGQVQQLESVAGRDILRYMLVSMLKPCEYRGSVEPHFGLGLAPYGHGILPQHRYGDLLMQRVWHWVFTEGRDRKTQRSKMAVNLRSSECHGQVTWGVLPPEREKQLQEDLAVLLPRLTQQEALYFRAMNDLEGLRKTEIMRSRTGEHFFGMITSVQTYGFFVELEELLVEGLVHVSSLKDDWYEFPQTGGRSKGRQSSALVGRRSGRQFRLGDRVEVQVRGVDYYRQQVDLDAVVAAEPDPEREDMGLNAADAPRDSEIELGESEPIGDEAIAGTNYDAYTIESDPSEPTETT
ncbi:MAG: VacB/RNase II family 3'-5' exoribonuclease [Oscillatoriales cyanobacterium SM2_2_1]|nr:VacB/RNase II family 3'-5' exoribonuclease [Oscillatoriales cyanobacterium SM2_2_1]